MAYLYYPGCSLKSSGRAYEESLLAVFAALEVPLKELPDWNCCGATAYMSIDESKAFGLAARNLALAAMEAPQGVDLVAPCAACYLVLTKAQHYMAEHPPAGRAIRAALKSVGVGGGGEVRVRHPLDVLVNDVGLERIARAARTPLQGMKIACYYGCQIVRPYPTIDNEFAPTLMDRLLVALGAETVEWPLKTRCCGGMLTGTIPEVGTNLASALLEEANVRGANAIATACPLCQFNLECFQDRLLATRLSRRIPVAYFTQIMGVALGLEDRALGLQRLFVPLEPALAGVKREEQVHA